MRLLSSGVSLNRIIDQSPGALVSSAERDDDGDSAVPSARRMPWRTSVVTTVIVDER